MSKMAEFFGLDTESGKKAVAEENLILDVQVAIQKAMTVHAVTQKALADRLGVSASQISQWLNEGGSNLTLRTVAKILDALDAELQVRLSPKQKAASATARKPDQPFDFRCLTAKGTPWRMEDFNDNRAPKALAA